MPLDYPRTPYTVSRGDMDWNCTGTLLRLVAECSGEAIATLRSPRRWRRLSHARQVAMWLVRNVARRSYPEVGLALGGKDHSTAIFACRAVDNDIRTDGPRAALLVAIIERAARSG